MEDLNNLRFDSRGLIPAVIQDANSKEVLMLAYMNQEALEKTLATNRTWFWSRSRQSLWNKGETSGHFQEVKSIAYDCDGDTLLLQVEQKGSACHTGERSCFYRNMNHSCQNSNSDIEQTNQKDADGLFGTNDIDEFADDLVTQESLDGLGSQGTKLDNGGIGASGIEKNKSETLNKLYEIIEDRKANPKEGSYTNYLFTKGLDKILKKVGEETAEVIIAAKNSNKEELIYESSDLLYHLLVLLKEKNVTLDEIYAELYKRYK